MQLQIPSTGLILQNKDKDVVSSNSEHQEGNNLKDDQGGRDPDPGVETHGGQNRTAHHQDPPQTHQKLGVHLQHKHTCQYPKLFPVLLFQYCNTLC